MSLTVSYVCWLSLTVSPSAMELQHISHSLPWYLAVYNYLSSPMNLLHVYHCLSLLLAVPHCLYQWH